MIAAALSFILLALALGFVVVAAMLSFWMVFFILALGLPLLILAVVGFICFCRRLIGLPAEAASMPNLPSALAAPQNKPAQAHP